MKVDKISEVSERGKGQRKVAFDCLPNVPGGLWLDLTYLKGLEARKSYIMREFQ